ncbi:MAG: flagellar hook-basal body complex protein [Rhodobacteraceae bacterium]|nr:flagellar hook-basal body complex protein [Paracoccaceae bacterium]
MSITNAMQTGVSGLLANATAIGNISDNIANANTNAFRRTFTQMVTSTSGNIKTSVTNSVRAVSALDMSRGTEVFGTGSSTDMAVRGDGFFVVSKTPNDPNVANYMLTRAGSFLPDANGDLRNAAGFYLAGFAYGEDSTLGAVDANNFSELTTVNVDTGLTPGSPTTAISVAGNLPSQEAGLPTPGDPFSSSAEFFSPLGEASRLKFSWQPSSTENTWELTFEGADGATYGSVNVEFNDSGANAGSPATYSGVTSTAPAPAAFAFDVTTGIATLTVDNGTTPQVLTVAAGAPNSFDGMTQFSGDYTPVEVVADGAASGNLLSTEIDDKGNIFGLYDNGNRKPLFNIPLANVTNPVGLEASTGNNFSTTRFSGAALLSFAGEGGVGTISNGVLESSNVEIAQELTDLIRIQRAYSTNAKIITTTDEMLDETTRLKR